MTTKDEKLTVPVSLLWRALGIVSKAAGSLPQPTDRMAAATVASRLHHLIQHGREVT